MIRVLRSWWWRLTRPRLSMAALESLTWDGRRLIDDEARALRRLMGGEPDNEPWRT